MAKKEKILLINSQLVEYYISGFTNRFIGLWCYLQKKGPGYAGKVHWITNRSLWHKYFNGKPVPPNVTVMQADLKWFKYTSRIFYPFYIIYTYYRHRCTSIHVAASIIDFLYLVRLFNLLGIPYCFTFASNGVEMGSYNSERMRKKWLKLFALARNIEVLNPTNTVDMQRGRKFISPTSFPYTTEFRDLPEALLTNPERGNTVVFCGSFIAQKNPLLAIAGFERFLLKHGSDYPDAKLVLVGKGDLLEDVQQEIRRINAAFGNKFIEIVPDAMLVELLSTSRIFLSLQDYDNYPSQSLMEAMLFCNSVVSINNGDTSRLVQVERGNVLLEQKDPEVLGEAISSLLRNGQLNRANRDLITQQFSPEVFAHHFFEMHRQIRQEPVSNR